MLDKALHEAAAELVLGDLLEAPLLQLPHDLREALRGAHLHRLAEAPVAMRRLVELHGTRQVLQKQA